MLAENYYQVLSYLEHETIALVARLSRHHQRSVAQYFYSRFATLMGLFCLDASRVLPILRDRKAVISGSVATLMILPGAFIPGDLDIYVSAYEATSLIIELMVGNSFIYRQTNVGQEYRRSPGVSTVHVLEGMRSGKNVHVVVVDGDDPIMAVLQFDATHALNFITATGFGCAYPRLTMAKLSLYTYTYSLPTQSRSLWSKKYSNRGITVGTELAHFPIFPEGHVCGVSAFCPRTVRHLRDRHMYYSSFMVGTKPMVHTLAPNYHGNIIWGCKLPCGPERGRPESGWDADACTASYVYSVGPTPRP